MTFLLVMLGAALGAPARWLLDQAIQTRRDRVFPLGTLTINVTGSFLLGLILAAAATGHVSAAFVAFAGVGFCGGFTTYSTLGYETIRLAEDGSGREALLNVTASLALGMTAAVAGWWLVQSVWP